MEGKENELYCPQCGLETEQLHEGYCEPCLEDRQQHLNEYNFSYDRWENLTNNQRKQEILSAIT